MAAPVRTTVAAALLFGGIIWSLPMQPGHSVAAPAMPRYTADAPVAFSIAATRATLVVSGHTASSLHEQRLQAAAAEFFPDHELQTDFRPLGVVPDWWGSATTTLIEALAVADAPRASLTGQSLMVRGVVSNPARAKTRLRTMQDALPETLKLDLQLIDVDQNTSSAAFCRRELGALQFAPIYFNESGTQMRTSAVPVLEQVAAFADACRLTTVSITGHTDSSGDESYNRALSLSRARVVAAWLQDHGIDKGRIEVVGAGSSIPVADNRTRYGRSLNRRIDIAFSVRPPD